MEHSLWFTIKRRYQTNNCQVPRIYKCSDLSPQGKFWGWLSVITVTDVLITTATDGLTCSLRHEGVLEYTAKICLRLDHEKLSQVLLPSICTVMLTGTLQPSLARNLATSCWEYIYKTPVPWSIVQIFSLFLLFRS